MESFSYWGLRMFPKHLISFFIEIFCDLNFNNSINATRVFKWKQNFSYCRMSLWPGFIGIIYFNQIPWNYSFILWQVVETFSSLMQSISYTFFYLYILTLFFLLYLWCFQCVLCSIKITVINHSWIPFPTKSCLFIPVTIKSSFSIFEFSGYNFLKLDFYFISVYIECKWPVFWSSNAYIWLIGKVPDAGKDWGQKEREASEDEVVGWHHLCTEH